MLILLAAASLMLAQGSEPAQAAAPAKPAAAKPEKPKLICTRETGIASVIPKRVCRTPEQIAAEVEAARRVAEHANSSTPTCQSDRC